MPIRIIYKDSARIMYLITVLFSLLKVLTCCEPEMYSNPFLPTFLCSGACPPCSQICCSAAPPLFPTPAPMLFFRLDARITISRFGFSDIRKPPNKGIKKTTNVRGLVEPRGDRQRAAKVTGSRIKIKLERNQALNILFPEAILVPGAGNELLVRRERITYKEGKSTGQPQSTGYSPLKPEPASASISVFRTHLMTKHNVQNTRMLN